MRPLKLSQKPFCIGFPGAMKCQTTLLCDPAWKSDPLMAIFAVVCLLCKTTGSAYAQCDITQCATEWSGDSVISLGGLPGFTSSIAHGINDAGKGVGFSEFGPPPPPPSMTVPESSTWAMMLIGFAGLAFAGYRGAQAGHAPLRTLSSTG
jgi:hypothetical protein